jgi:hypothetical protein
MSQVYTRYACLQSAVILLFFLLDVGKLKDFCGEELPLADNFL